MASRKILVQLDIAAASNLTSPSSGFVGFSAKADGLYQKIGTAPELRLLTSADVQNAILADGSITGAVSQAQIFTMGVKLYNLTQGYIPYASGATKLLSNSPIYTDGTSVGIGTTNLGASLDVVGNIRNSAGDFITTSYNIRLLDSTSAVAFRSLRANAWSDNKDTRFFQVGTIDDNVAFTTLYGTVANRMMFTAASTQITTGNYQGNAPTGIFEVSNGANGLFNILSSGNVGIGTNPNDKLDVLGKIRATTDNSSYANFYAVSNGGQYPRAFYGIKGDTGYDNVGFTVANDSNDTTERRAYFSASTLSNAAAATAHSIVIQIYPTYGEIYAGQEAGSENLPLYLYSGSNNLLNGLTLRPTSVSGASAINVGIGTMYPTASLHIKEGTAIAGTAPLKLTSGVNLTTPEVGSIEFSSSRLYFTPSSTRETVAFLSDITSASHAPITLGEIGSAPNSNGITLIGQVLNLEPASALYGGVLTNSAQTIAGAKTLSSLLTASAGIANSDSYIQTGTSENTFTGITNINNAISYNYRNFTYGGTSNDGAGRWSKLVTFQTTGQYNNDKYEILIRSRYYVGKLYVVINSNSNVTTNLVDFRFISDFINVNLPDIRIYRSQDSTYLSTWDVYIYNTSYSSYEYAENNTRSHNGGGNGKVVTFYQNTYEDPPVGSIAVSYGPYFNGIVSATGITSSGTINFSSLTASKVVFTDGSKNLTSTGIGTASQFIKGDGSLDSNTYITSGSISGFVPYTGANDNVNLGTFGLHSGDVSIDNALIVGNPNNSSYTDGGYLLVQTPSASYASLNFYSKDTSDSFGIIQITANPEEGISLRAISNDYSSDSYLEIRHWELGFYTNLQKRLEIAQNGSINAFGNTITSTGGFIGNASTATKLQTARTITIGNQSLSFDGTANLTYTLSGIGIPVGTASQYIRGDLSLATFPTIHTGSGASNRVTFWDGTNSLSSTSNLEWNNTLKNLSVIGGVSVNDVSSNSMSTNTLFTQAFQLGSYVTAGYVLTTDAYGNGTWKAPTGGGVTIGAIGSVPNANGMTISGQTLSLQPASALYGGILTNSTQTISGAKTLSSLLTASAGIANNGSYTQTGTSANTFTGNSTFAGLTITGTILGDTDSARNLMANNVYTYGLAGYQYTNGRLLVSGSLNRMVLSRESFYETNRAKTLTHGYYSVSFWYKVESYTSGTALAPNLNDVALATLNVSGNKAWTFYSSTVYMTTTSFGFLDIEGTFGSTVTISDIMIVRSAKTPQQYVLAPEDIIQYDSTGNVGIGIPAPNQQLEITKNFRLPSTAGTTPYGIIYKGTAPFIHDFNYGNNGTVTTDGLNTFVGINAGNLTMGSTANETYHASYNTGFGFQTLYSNTTGFHNTAVGFNSLQSNTTGYQNTANGYASLSSNTTGHQNTANGVYSLYLNTTGYQNTANGVYSLYLNTIGSNNTALGYNSGCYLADGTTGRTTGNNGLYLGLNSKASANGTDNEIVIGYNAIGVGSNKTVIGNSSVTDTYFGSSTGSSKLWASALNLSSLTASKVVFTDGSKNLTSTGIGTASQFIKGDGSLDSNTYLTTGTAIISGSGVDGRLTFWSGTNSLSSTSSLGWNDTTKNLGVTGGIVANSVSASISVSTNSLLTNSFSLIATTTAGYVLTADAYGNGTWQAPQGGGNIVSSVFGRTGTVVAVNGDYNTSQVTENTNLYFTDSRARVAISLTINGQSGASTYNNSTGILNVPNYSLTGLGGVPKTRTITINGEVQDLSANRTWNVGDLLSTGSYSNPSWLTSLAWSKITNKPTTFYGYGITETPWTSYLPLSGGTLTGDLNSKRIICQSIIGDDYNTGAIEILGSYDNTFYPTLGFHQPSKFAASIQLRGAIDFRLYAQGGTTYANLTTNKLISASLQIGTSTTSGYVLTADANGNGTWQAPPTGGGSYTLPTASASVLGCVKIGSGITISSGVISVSTNYEAPLTFSSGLTRSGNAISVTSGTYVPFVGADRDVNLASYSIYAYDFLVYSDINLKCNIEDIKMKKLDINYKQFEYKTSRGEKRYGVIAQELLSIAPEFVSESNNSYAVKYTDLLIYEVAQLKEEVKQLKSLLCR